MSELSENRKCKGCVAHDGKRCELGYKQRCVYHNDGSAHYYPNEPCPKPRTIKAFLAEPKVWEESEKTDFAADHQCEQDKLEGSAKEYDQEVRRDGWR